MLVSEQTVRTVVTGVIRDSDPKALVRKAMENLLRRSLRVAAESLFNQVGSADPDRRQWLFKASSYLPDLLVHLPARAFATSEPAPEPVALIRLETLSLQDDGAVSEDIVLKRLSERLDRSCAYPIWHLRNYSEALGADPELLADLRSCYPAALVEHLRSALQSQVPEAGSRSVIIEALERPLMEGAGPFYKGLLTVVQCAGFEPNAARPLSADGGVVVDESAAYEDSVPTFLIPLEWMPGQVPDPHLPRDALEPLALLSQMTLEGTAGMPQQNAHELRPLVDALARTALEHRATLYRCGHRIWRILDGLQALVSLSSTARRTSSIQMGQALGRMSLEAYPTDTITSYLLDDLRHRRRPTQPLEVHKQAALLQLREAGTGRDLNFELGQWLQSTWLPLASVIHLRFGSYHPKWTAARTALVNLLDATRWLPWATADLVIDQTCSRFNQALADLDLPAEYRDRPVLQLRDSLMRCNRSNLLLDLVTFKPRIRPTPAGGLRPSSHDPSVADEVLGTAGLWRMAFPLGSWFRFVDRDASATRWGTAGLFYPSSTSIGMRGVHVEQEILVRRDHLLSDLRYGRAEPIDPAPEQTYAIVMLTSSISKDLFPVVRPDLQKAG